MMLGNIGIQDAITKKHEKSFAFARTHTFFKNRYNFRITTDITTGDVPAFLVNIYEHLPHTTSRIPLKLMKL